MQRFRAVQNISRVRWFNSLLLRPLTEESALQHVEFKSKELLKILDQTREDVLKLQETDYNDIEVMTKKLPGSDLDLFKKLTQSVLMTNFYEINTRMLGILLDMVETRQDGSLMVLLMKQLCKTQGQELSLDVKNRLFEMWGLETSAVEHQMLIEMGDEMKMTNSVVLNVMLQTHLLRNEVDLALRVAKQMLLEEQLLERYSIELLTHRLLESFRVNDAFELIDSVHGSAKNPFLNGFMPLSNQQFGRLLSLCIKMRKYVAAKSLMNKYCYFQTLHYVDQGSLLKLSRLASEHRDYKQLTRIARLMGNIERNSFNSQYRQELSVKTIESRWYNKGTAEACRPLLADLNELASFPNVAATDLPIITSVVSQLYDLQDVETIVPEFIQVLDESKQGAKLFLCIILSAVSKLGKPDLFFAIFNSLSSYLPGEDLVDEQVSLYLLRSYYNCKDQLDLESAKFIVSLVLKEREQEFGSKVFALAFKTLAKRYPGNVESLILPLITKCSQLGYSIPQLQSRAHHPKTA